MRYASQIWVVSTLLISIVLIVLTMWSSNSTRFWRCCWPASSWEHDGYGATGYGKCYWKWNWRNLGFLAAVIGLGTILGKMMEVPGPQKELVWHFNAAGGFRLSHYGAGWPDLRHHAVCWSGRVLLIPLAFSIAKKTNTSLLNWPFRCVPHWWLCTAWFPHIRCFICCQ